MIWLIKIILLCPAVFVLVANLDMAVKDYETHRNHVTSRCTIKATALFWIVLCGFALLTMAMAVML